MAAEIISTIPITPESTVKLLKTLPFTPRRFNVEFLAGARRHPPHLSMDMWRYANPTRSETRTWVWRDGAFHEEEVRIQDSLVNESLAISTARPSIPESIAVTVENDKGGRVRAYDVFLRKLLPVLVDGEFGPVSGTLTQPGTRGLSVVEFEAGNATLSMDKSIGKNTRRSLTTWFEPHATPQPDRRAPYHVIP